MGLISGVEALVLGAGAVGGHVSASLAAAARIVIHQVDFDVVDRRHTYGGRTIYEPSHIHKRKVYAAKDKIERDHPNAVIQPYPYNVMHMPDLVLLHLASRSAVVINAIDDPRAMLRINDLLYPHVEVLFVALHSAGASGHVILTLPGISACLRCSLDISSAAEISTLHAEPALAVDIKNVANHCATIALETIYAKVTGRPVRRWDISKNIFFFANQREEADPDGPAIRLQQAQKRPDCPICAKNFF
jgi:molybdopterin/thiamine biosynthesis adenylyltransferase